MIIRGNMPPKRVFTLAQVRECILNESGQNNCDDSSPKTDDSESDDENNLCIGRLVRNAHGAGVRVRGEGLGHVEEGLGHKREELEHVEEGLGHMGEVSGHMRQVVELLHMVVKGNYQVTKRDILMQMHQMK